MSDPKRHGADAFSAIEEEFFRDGDAMNAASPTDAGVGAPVPRGLWSRLFKRAPRPTIAIVHPRPSTSS